MNHIEERIVEAYVRHPEDLDSAIRQSVAGHLDDCAACRSIADFLRAFYAELDGLGDEVSPQVDEFVAARFPGARIIPLHPFRPELDQVYAGDGYTVVLAAMSHEPPAPRFQTVATLASVQKDTLLRILRDNVTNTFRLYILSGDRRKREHAIISFPELALDFVADEKGQVTFALAEKAVPEDWEALKSVLRLPICEVCLRAEQLQQNPLRLEKADEVIDLAYNHEALTLEVRPCRPEAPVSTLAVMQTAAGQIFFVNLYEGRGACRLDHLPETLTVRFYC